MPLPKPKKEETQREFISRCMADATVRNDFSSDSQRAAVCYSQWRGKNKTNLQSIHAHSEAMLRYEMFNGKKHVVVPVVMMVEGVHHGLTGGPTFYPAEELSKFPEAWNNRPVPVFHPTEEGAPVSCNSPDVLQEWTVGYLFNTTFDDGKLKSEAWIDVERCSAMYPTLYSSIIAGEPIEVSTGMYVDEDFTEGVWNGESYTAIARNIRPDHLAFLPGSRGACSWQDGCGAPRINGKEDGMKDGDAKKKVEPKVHLEQKSPYLLKLFRLFTDEFSLNDRVQAIRQWADAKDIPGEVYNYIHDVFEGYFVYSVERSGGNSKMFRQNYKFDTNNKLVVEGDPVEVRQDVSYIEVNSDQKHNENNKDHKEEDMNVNEETKKLVDAIIANKGLGFTEEDRESLSALQPCMLKKMQMKDTEVKANADDTDADDGVKDNKSKDKKEDMKDNKASDEGITFANKKQLEDFINAQIKAHADNSKRDEYISALEKANTGMTKEVLASMPIAALEVLHDKFVIRDYSGGGFPIRDNTNGKNEVPKAPTVVLGSPDDDKKDKKD